MGAGQSDLRLLSLSFLSLNHSQYAAAQELSNRCLFHIYLLSIIWTHDCDRNIRSVFRRLRSPSRLAVFVTEPTNQRHCLQWFTHRQQQRSSEDCDRTMCVMIGMYSDQWVSQDHDSWPLPCHVMQCVYGLQQILICASDNTLKLCSLFLHLLWDAALHKHKLKFQTYVSSHCIILSARRGGGGVVVHYAALRFRGSIKVPRSRVWCCLVAFGEKKKASAHIYLSLLEGLAIVFLSQHDSPAFNLNVPSHPFNQCNLLIRRRTHK